MSWNSFVCSWNPKKTRGRGRGITKKRWYKYPLSIWYVVVCVLIRRLHKKEWWAKVKRTARLFLKEPSSWVYCIVLVYTSIAPSTRLDCWIQPCFFFPSFSLTEWKQGKPLKRFSLYSTLVAHWCFNFLERDWMKWPAAKELVWSGHRYSSYFKRLANHFNEHPRRLSTITLRSIFLVLKKSLGKRRNLQGGNTFFPLKMRKSVDSLLRGINRCEEV